MHRRTLKCRLALAGLLTLVAASGCTTASDDIGAIQGGWHVTSVVRSPRPWVVGSTISLSIQPGGSPGLGISAGCNQMSAPSVRLASGRLVVDGPMVSTAMACATYLMDQDVWFSNLVTTKPTVTLSGTDLRLSGPDAEVVLRRD